MDSSNGTGPSSGAAAQSPLLQLSSANPKRRSPKSWWRSVGGSNEDAASAEGSLNGSVGGAFGALLRSARKSTDSLRSGRSNASRQDAKSILADGPRSGSRQSLRPLSSSVVSSIPPRKHITPSANTSGWQPSAVEPSTSRSSTSAGNMMEGILENPALEFYELPSPSDEEKGNPLATAAAAAAVSPPSTRGGHADESSRGAQSPATKKQSAAAMQLIAPPTAPNGNDHRFSVMEASTPPPRPPPKEVEPGSSFYAKSGSAKPQETDAALRRSGSIIASSNAHDGGISSSTNNNTINNNNANAFKGWTSESDSHEQHGVGSTVGHAEDQGTTAPNDDMIYASNDEESRASHARADDSTAIEEGSAAWSKYSSAAASSTAKKLARQSLSKFRGGNILDSSKYASPKSSTDGHAMYQSFGTDPRSTTLKESSANDGTQWASDKNGGGDGNTIAQLYAVFGLPKDPSVWTLAEEDCVAGVHHMPGAVSRFWRPEVLGCSICPPPSVVLGQEAQSSSENGRASQDDSNKWDGREADGKKANSPKFIEMSDGRGGIEKAETARVLSKALKLSFTREVEIVVEQGHYPPNATSHTFSFSVPTVTASGDDIGIATRGVDGRKAAMAVGLSGGMPGASSGVGEGYGLDTQHRSVQGGSEKREGDGPRLATFYGVVLTVWSAADEKRAKTIRKELSRAAKMRKQPKSGAARGGSAGGNDESTSADYAAKSPGSVFFMPYAICIVSRFPLYNLLSDWNKMAWHKYSRNIEMHNKLMSTVLRHPAPRLGEEISVGSPEKDLSLHSVFPGAVEWGSGLTGIDFPMWPLFKTLSIENILTICEIALGHNGRILYVSRHPALMGMAVEATKYLVEQRGWRGVAHQNCHARDVRIYLEDPGSWIIAIGSELRSVADLSKEICLVDLDINMLDCARPPVGAVSKRGVREKRLRKLMQAVYVSNVDCQPPREFVDAYPGARFRPLSRLVTREANSAYEQLYPPVWWNQATALQAIDRIFSESRSASLVQRVLKRQKAPTTATDAELSAILALRKRASTFVDARDGLENKIGRLNKRLAFLIGESEMWRAQFGKIQSLVDRLTREAGDLRQKVDKERRESKRLSTTLAQRDLDHVQLQVQLKETETAREEAIGELKRMQDAMQSVEHERTAMMEEIRGIMSGGGDIEDVNMSMSRLDLPKFNTSFSRSSSPTGSQASMTPSQAAEYILHSRALAEARINQRRPSRTMSRNGSQSGHSATAPGLTRSLSQDRGERVRRVSNTGSINSNMHHFPDEQMNFEIQQRTSVVTDQISRIQQQLESTLTQLEGRRSGTYERESERRLRSRRGSNASLSSRYEYRSSLGHGTPAASVRADSAMGGGYASEDAQSEAHGYEQIESIADAESRPSDIRRRRESRNAGPPPTASSASLRDAYNSRSNEGSPGSSVTAPIIQAKSLARQRLVSNPWKESSSTATTPDTSQVSSFPFLQNGDTPATSLADRGEGVETETMMQVPAEKPTLYSAESTGAVSQPLLTALATASGGHGSSGQHSMETTEESGPKSPPDIPSALDPTPKISSQGPENEVLPAPGGWTMEVAQGKSDANDASSA